MRRLLLVLLAVAGLVLGAGSLVRADYVGGLDPSGDNYLSLRAGPSTKDDVIRRLGPDTLLTVLDRDGAWRLVELEDGTRGWAYGAYVFPGSPPGTDETWNDESEPWPEEEGGLPVGDENAVPPVGGWTVYANDRFGTTIDYPADTFLILPPPENDDGRQFYASAGTARFSVYAANNVFDRSLEELMGDDLGGLLADAVTYKRRGEGWYVLSGYFDTDVFYRKILLSSDGTVVHTFEITYPKALKRVFDPVVARMANSLAANPPAIDATPDEPASASEEAAPPSQEAVPGIESISPEVALDSWRAPLEEELFDGSETPLFLPHEAHGGVYATSARYADGELVVDVPANSGWGKVGLLSGDPLVWMDDFHDDAVTRVTFTLDPQRTTGFGLALAQPGWGGVMGNDPGYPGVRFYWIRQPDGASAKTELHIDPHGEGDFWKDSVAPAAPGTVSFVLRPGSVEVELDGKPLASRDWPALRSGIGFRIYAFSHAADVNLPAAMGLRAITVQRTYPTVAEQLEPAPGVAYLPTETLFSGAATPAFEAAANAGGDFDAFAHYAGGALDIDVPPGNSWGKTGLLSADPVVVLDERSYETPVRLTLTVDPKRTKTFVLALSGDKAVEMWPSHNSWITFSRRDDLGTYLLQINAGPYNDRVRQFPIAWFDQHWDGRIQYDFGNDLACIRIPSGPSLCAQQPISVGNRLYATILAHAPNEGDATGLRLLSITRGLVTPPGLTAEKRWFFVDDKDFDPGKYLEDLGALLQ